jgi:hypothetical protein
MVPPGNLLFAEEDMGYPPGKTGTVVAVNRSLVCGMAARPTKYLRHLTAVANPSFTIKY